ncbi:MAG: hypothetical protein ACLU8W_10640 [Clostridia bacterium]
MLAVSKWVLWIGGGIVIVLGAVTLNPILALCGVLLCGFGSMLALLLRVEGNVDELDYKMSFIIRKMGWTEELEQYGSLSPEQEAIRRSIQKERAELEQRERELLESIRKKHPGEELTPEQLGKLLEEERINKMEPEK